MLNECGDVAEWVKEVRGTSEPECNEVDEPSDHSVTSRVHNLETWLSGRKRLTANEVGSKRPRRFESFRLRKHWH